MRLRGASIRECVAFIWLRGRVHDSRKGPWSGPYGTERTRATLR